MKGEEADEDEGQTEEQKMMRRKKEGKIDEAVARSGTEEDKVDNDNEVVA